MARLPTIPNRFVTIDQPRRLASGADIARPYQALAGALDKLGDTLEEKQVADAQTEGQNAVTRAEDGSLQVEYRGNWTQAGRTYNRAAQQAYLARLSGDIRTAAMQQRDTAANNPETFDQSWDAYSQQIVAAAPEQARGAVTALLENEGQRVYDGIVGKKRTMDLQAFEGQIKQEISLLDDELATLARNGGTGSDDYKEKLFAIRDLYDELVNNPDFTVTQKEAEIRIKRMESRHLAEAAVGTVQRVAAGQGYAAAEKEASRLIWDESLDLSPSERREYFNLALSGLKTASAEKRAALRELKAESRDIRRQLDEGIAVDDAVVDATLGQLTQLGGGAEAVQLMRTRNRARFMSGFNALPDSSQIVEAERYNSGAGGVVAPAPVAPDVQSRGSQAMSFFMARGYTQEQAAGIVGNLIAESNLRPSGAVGDAGTAFGVAQWRGERLTRLKRFANSQGKDWQDFETQLEFVDVELKNHETGAYKALKNASTVDEATAAFIGYERPKGWTEGNPRGGHNYRGRLANAAAFASGEVTMQAYVDPEVVRQMRKEIAGDARDLWNGIKGGFANDFPPSADDLSLLSRQLSLIDDQDFREEVANDLRNFEQGYLLQALPPNEVEAFLGEIRSGGDEGFSVESRELLQTMQAAAKRQMEQLKTDPYGFGIDRRVVGNPAPLDPSDPEGFAANLQARQQATQTVSQRFLGGDPIGVLRPHEADSLGRFYTNATPDERLALVGSISDSLSGDTLKATLAQFAGKANTQNLAFAGSLHAVNPEAAAGIIRGEALLAENPKLAPANTDANRLRIDGTSAGDGLLPIVTFGPGMERGRQGLMKAIEARYADLSHQAGDTSAALNEDRFETAANEVTGGLLDFNGRKVIAPEYGMSQDAFDTLMQGLTDEDLAGATTVGGTAITADMVNGGMFRDGAVLRAVGDGQYVLAFGPPGAETYAVNGGPFRSAGAFVLDLRQDNR